MSGQYNQNISLSLEDLVLINNALNEIINGPSAIELWEFQMRIGVTLEKAQELLCRVAIAIEKHNAH